MAPKQIFIDKDTNEPICFFLDATIDSSLRKTSAASIEACGGRVVKFDTDAKFVLIAKTADKLTRQAAYAANTDKKKRHIVVLYLHSVRTCIRNRNFEIPAEKTKPMSGNPGYRQNYWPEEDRHLARFFAALMPDLASGGRKGKNIYQMITRLGNTDPDYAWAKRHPWQSWLGHYKRNQEKINQLVEWYISEMNPTRQHLWTQDRQLNKFNGVGRRQHEEEEDEEEEEEENEDGDEEGDENEDEEDEDEGQGLDGNSEGGHSDRGGEDRGRQDEDNSSPAPSDGGKDNSDADWDAWNTADPGQLDLSKGLPVDAQPVQLNPERRARFIATSGSRRVEFNQSESSVPPPSLRRKYSFESTPNKRPRLESVDAESRPKVLRGARRPPNWKPNSDVDSNSDVSEEDYSNSDPEVPHSFYTEENEDEDTMLQGEHAPTMRSAASSSGLPLSRDKTLVASGSLSKGKAVVATLSSASGGKVYLDEVRVDVQDEVELQQAIISNEVEVPEGRDTSPALFPPESNLGDDHVQAPVANAARTRQKRAEQTHQTERSAAYRMTRSRSRSVEPSEFVSLSTQRTSKRKQKARATEPEVIDEEEQDPSDHISSEHSFETGKPQQETLTAEEEEDVVNMVTNEDDISGLSNITSLTNKKSTTLSRRESSPPSDSDDRQTIHRLTSQTQTLEGVIRKGPRQSDALLQRFNAELAKRKVRMVLPANLAMARATQKLAASLEPSEPRGVPSGSRLKNPPVPSSTRTSTNWKPPNTPTSVNMGRLSQRRAASDASSSNDTAESIPIAGTRAAAYKRRIEEEERFKPYTPPRGTRASLHLQQQGSRANLWE